MIRSAPPSVLPIGFGASGAWAKSWFADGKAQALVHQALDAGITHFDTAGFYASGLAEIRLGQAIKAAKTEKIEISSKTGTRYHKGAPPEKDFSLIRMRLDVETSLKRLGREELDILYLHGPGLDALPEALDALAVLKQEGKIRLAGVCGHTEELSAAVESGQVDIIMGPYNVLDRANGDVFDSAKARNMRTIGIATLVPGLGAKRLSRPRSPSDLWYLLRAVRQRPEPRRAARNMLDDLARKHDCANPEALMLRFALSHRSLDMVLTNTTRSQHLAANIDAAQKPPLPDTLLDALDELATA